MSQAQATTNEAFERSAKRTRTNTGPSPTATSKTVTHSDKFWFDDGNVVLRVESTLFRVHRGILARHSPVFCDLFKLPQPPTEQEDVIEGCPIVELPGNKKDDWENVFTLIYDHETDYKNNKTFIMPVLKSMLQLGRKYQLDVIYKAAIASVRTVVPTTFQELTKGKLSPHPLLKAENNLFDLLAIVLELGIQKFLPTLFYYCVREFTLDRIIEQHSGTNPKPPYDCVAKLILGREWLISSITKNYLAWITAAGVPGGAKCKDNNSPYHGILNTCKPFRSNAARNATKSYTRDVRLALMPGDANYLQMFKAVEGQAINRVPGQCEECAKEILRLQNVSRTWIWDNLPGFFRLPKWDDMEPL